MMDPCGEQVGSDEVVEEPELVDIIEEVELGRLLHVKSYPRKWNVSSGTKAGLRGRPNSIHKPPSVCVRKAEQPAVLLHNAAH